MFHTVHKKSCQTAGPKRITLLDSESRCMEYFYSHSESQMKNFQIHTHYVPQHRALWRDKNRLFLFTQNKRKKRKLPKGSAGLPLLWQLRRSLQSLNFLLHPNEVSMPAWTTSFHLFLKVYVQYSLYLLAFLVSKELLLRLQSPQGGNYLFKNILSSHYTILTESTVKWLTKHKV